MKRRDTMVFLLTVPIAAAMPPQAEADAPAGKWSLALHTSLPPFQSQRMINPFAGGYPGKIWQRLPVADRPLVLGSYAGFTVTGHREI
jgi:hypothetical protein